MKKIQALLRVLKEIYPPLLILIVFFPIAIGFIIDNKLSDARYILINLLWLPLFTIPYIFLQKRIIYHLIVSFFFIVGFIETGHWIILKGPITITSLFVISNTNIQEAFEFFDLKATYWLIVLIPYSCLFIISLRKSPNISPSKMKPWIIGFIFLVSAGFILENAIHGRHTRKGVPQIAKVTFSFIDKRNLYKEAMQDIDPREVNAVSSFDVASQTFVLILGESCNRHHMSLYGAIRKTNPLLETRDDLIVYNDVISPYSNTLNSVLTIFSQSNLEQNICFKESVDIIDVFHSAGFKTYWISNQSPIGIWDNLVTVLAKKTDYIKFVNTSSNSSFEAILTTSYDSKLFEPFIEVLEENVSRKFIVIHLMGSHSAYSKRYPKSFEVFAGIDSKEKTIAEYDNSILYNDYIVDSLLNILKSRNSTDNDKIAAAIYLSDHSENVYDEMDRVGHDFSNELPKANVDIPFLVWLSPSYIQMNKDLVESIYSNVNKPYVVDDLFHSMMDINGIQSPYLEEERSIFNQEFNELRTRILEDGKDYDKK
ncbi:MAG: phosphoethanolamine transferase [Bacteroidales bacterium]|nr:phosphoethanolamine transferase [Bacteroidales bacterium]